MPWSTKKMRQAGCMSNIVQLNELRPKLMYEVRCLPFFNAKKRCAWDVRPTGDYTVDCRTGRDYGVAFLESCDGSVGWASLLQHIVSDMIRAGPLGQTFRDGTRSVGGQVIGFMHVVGAALTITSPAGLAALAKILATPHDE